MGFNHLPGEILKIFYWDNGIKDLAWHGSNTSSSWSHGDNPPGDGFLAYIPVLHNEHQPEMPSYVEMRQIYVKASERRKGIATKLFKELEKRTKEIGIKQVVVVAAFHNEDQRQNPFCKFLESRGYQYQNKGPLAWDWIKNV